MSDIVERLLKEKAWSYAPDHAPDHARKDIQYVDGLTAHLDEGGKTNAGNVRDLISMVQWGACGVIQLSAEITALRARIAQLEASIADEREDAARAMQEACAKVAEATAAELSSNLPYSVSVGDYIAAAIRAGVGEEA